MDPGQPEPARGNGTVQSQTRSSDAVTYTPALEYQAKKQQNKF